MSTTLKHSYLVLFVLTVFPAYLYCQNGPADIYSGNVRYESSESVGTVTVISTGFAKKKSASIQKAFEEAFYTVLFRGLPGSQYELPMISDENGKKDDPVVQGLLQGGYNSFVTKSSLQSDNVKKRNSDGVKGVMIVYKITINCEALRRYLEQNKVIRKFGI